jgi:hypothetical protein
LGEEVKEWFAGRTVALVGNAESLFHKRYGDEIDAHDVVVRLNKAAMLWAEYKADLSHGTRTDVHMVFNIGEYRHRTPEWNPNIKLMHMSKLRQIKQHRELVHDMFSKDDHAKLSELVGYENPTTGLMALYYIDSCEPKKIDVYGFDWKETPTFTDMERKKDPLCYHDFDLEKKCCFDHFFKKSHIEWKN